jgi:PX domain
VPPIPPKKTMDNTDKKLIEERCQMLNLFVKSLVKCPYLYESEEFKLFIRPHIVLEKALTLLPKLNGE